MLKRIAALGAILCYVSAAWAQPATKPKDKDIVNIDKAITLENIQQGKKLVQKLSGNVELRQDSVYMYCDTAVIEDNVNVVARGNVIIQQRDTTSIFSDSLIYDGLTKKAVLFGNVTLVNGSQQLFTDRLDYDLSTKIATYFEGATLTNNKTQLSSKKGYYYVGTNEAYFKDSVIVIDPNFNLRADTLKFNTQSRTVFFLGPTIIYSDSSRVYCEDGFYNTQNNLAEFKKNAQYARGDQKATAETIRYNGKAREYTLDGDAEFISKDQEASATVIRYEELNNKYYLTGKASFRDSIRNIAADTIVYDRKNQLYSATGRSKIIEPPQILEADQVAYSQELGSGVAVGNIIWRDTSANLTVLCERANYNRQTNFLKAIGGQGGRPLLISKIENDSLYLTADTLLASQQIDTLAQDTSRMLFAYRDVRIFKSNLQGLCDSLVYTTTDSIFRLFQQPIMWSDTSQFTADTIHVQLSNERIDRIFLYNNSFIINSPDELFFNQIKGRNITAFFEKNELRRMDVQGNAESVYYARDEAEGYIGVNKTICSEMLLYFGDNQITDIRFFEAPKANLYPMRQADHDQLRIKGFRWENQRRPKSLNDLFVITAQISDIK